jgi:glycosyltransferase involved in cell wall biosynthesis
MTEGPLRVAFFGNFLSASLGGRSVCEDLADRFEARGARVVRASTRTPPVRRLLDMLTTATRTRRQYDVAYVDVYSGRGFFWAEAVSALLRVLGKPVVLTLRGGNLPAFSDRHPLRVGRLLRSATQVVAPSRYLADSMRRFREDIVILPNAVDVAAYRGRVRSSALPRLLWMRSFHSIYNPAMAARVLAIVRRRFPDARLVMAGPDKGDGSREAFLTEAERLGVSAHIDVTGNIRKADIPALLDCHDIFINTANVDNTPITLIEAMAAGLCIVTTDVGGIPALCRDRQTAILVAADDAERMAAACCEIIDDPPLATALSSNALAESAAYDRDVMLTRWEDLFGTLRA